MKTLKDAISRLKAEDVNKKNVRCDWNSYWSRSS